MYETEDECLFAIQHLSQEGYQASFAREGYRCFNGREIKPSEMPDLYVSNLPLEYTYEVRVFILQICFDFQCPKQIAILFKSYSAVSIKVLNDEQSRFKGTCFIKVLSIDMAERAISELHDKKFNDSGLNLIVRLAGPYRAYNSKFYGSEEKMVRISCKNLL